MRLDFKVTEQTLEALPTNSKPRRGSKKYLELGFVFSEDWSGLTATAFFQSGENSEPFLVGEEKIVRVPDFYASQDSFLLVLLGSDGETSVPTNAVSISLDESGKVWTSTAPDVEASTYEKLVALATESLAAANEAKGAVISEANAKMIDDGEVPSVEASILDGGKKRILNFVFHNIGKRGKSAYELAVEDGFKGTLQDWLHSLVELLGEHTLTKYAAALTGFCNGDMGGALLGLPIYDPDDGEFVSMAVKRGAGEADGEGVTVLSKGAIGETIAQAVAKVLPSNESSASCAYSAETDAYSVSGDKFPTVAAGAAQTGQGKGKQIILVPSKTNATSAPKLSINGGEAIEIRLRATRNQGEIADCPEATIPVPVGALMKGVPYTLTFCGMYWLVDSMIGGIGGNGEGSDCDCLPEINVTNDETEAMPEGCTLQVVLGAEPPEGIGGNGGGQLTEAQMQEIAQRAAKLVDVPSDEHIREIADDYAISVSGASVGQVLEVAAVDNNGVPTAWRAADKLSGNDGGPEFTSVADITTTEDVNLISVDLPSGISKIAVYAEGLVDASAKYCFLKANNTSLNNTGRIYESTTWFYNDNVRAFALHGEKVTGNNWFFIGNIGTMFPHGTATGHIEFAALTKELKTIALHTQSTFKSGFRFMVFAG